MVGLWETRFEELAVFNSEKDKTKFTAEYLQKMQSLQEEYFKKMKSLAEAYGGIIL
jgi:hypothetical protein